MHQTRHARIRQEMLAFLSKTNPTDDLRQVQTFIIKATSSNGGNFNKGLHAISMACAYQLGNISGDLHASSRQSHPMVGCINKRLHASNMTCVHLPRNIGQWNAASAEACTHRSWRVCIGLVIFASTNIDCGVRTSFRWERPMGDIISQGLHASAMGCAHQLGDIGHDLHASSRWCLQMTRCISHGLHASNKACAYQESNFGLHCRIHHLGDIDTWQTKSTKACTHNHVVYTLTRQHRLWIACIVQAMSANDRLHIPRSSYI